MLEQQQCLGGQVVDSKFLTQQMNKKVKNRLWNTSSYDTDKPVDELHNLSTGQIVNGSLVVKNKNQL